MNQTGAGDDKTFTVPVWTQDAVDESVALEHHAPKSIFIAGLQRVQLTPKYQHCSDLTEQHRRMTILNPTHSEETMLTVEDCRKKAAQWLKAAQSASDPKTRLGLCRVAETWTRLAAQIAEHPLTLLPSPSSARRPADLLNRGELNGKSSLHVGDVLRERLNLTNGVDDHDSSLT